MSRFSQLDLIGATMKQISAAKHFKEAQDIESRIDKFTKTGEDVI